MAKSKNETLYTIDEHLNAAKEVYGTTKLIVTAALRSGGKDRYTIDEAKALIKHFNERKVTQ